MRENKCKLCTDDDYGNSISTRYSEFTLEVIGNELHLSDDYGHEDLLEVSHCPMCGKELKGE